MTGIIFADDWRSYPTAIVDDKTTNQTAIEYAAILYKMGIKNYYSHLALLQPELQGVNPHDPKLNNVLRYKIKEECRYNPWYYLRECVMAPPISGDEPVRLMINRSNMALWFCYLNHIPIGLEQIRQTGKTFNKDVINAWVLYIAGRNTQITAVTKDDDLRVKTIARIKNIRNHLPQYLIPFTKIDKDNQTQIGCATYSNEYSIAVAQASKGEANKVGRGHTSANRDGDEVAFIKNFHYMLPAMQGAAGAAEIAAKRNEQPYGEILCTTAGDLSTPEGRFVYNLFNSGMGWNEHLWDCKNQEEVIEVIKNTARTRKVKEGKSVRDARVFVYAVFNHRQLGYSDEWLYETINKNTGEETDIEKDFFNKWDHGGTKSPLERAIIDKLVDNKKEPTWLEVTKEKYSIRWYRTEQQIRMEYTHVPMVVGMDSSDNVGKDYTCLVFCDVRDLATIGAMGINHGNILTFGIYVAELLINFPRLTLVPERKSSGMSIIDIVTKHLHIKGIDPFTRIYNTIVQKKDEDKGAFAVIRDTPMRNRDEEFYDKRKSTFGIVTTGRERNELYNDVFKRSCKRLYNRVTDAPLISQIIALEEINNRIDHPEGGNDDYVVTWLLAQWLLTYGRNLSHYGIDPRIVDSYRDELDDQEFIEERKEQEETSRLEIRIKEILAELKVLEDENLIHIREKELNYLFEKLRSYPLTGINTVNDLLMRYEEIREAERYRKQGNSVDVAGVMESVNRLYF